MNTRQALNASLALEENTPPRSIAEIAKREVLKDLHRQLSERLTYARGCLEADAWADAAIQFAYVASLLEAIAGTEAGNNVAR